MLKKQLAYLPAPPAFNASVLAMVMSTASVTDAYTLADFDYALPDALIAQAPATERVASRLLVVNGQRREDCVFGDLPRVLSSEDLLVVNDSRVMHARLFGRKESGGQVEVLVERIEADGTVLAQVRASKSPRAGTSLRLADTLDVRVMGRAGEADEFFRLDFGIDALAQIERLGRLPLPPYIERSVESGDESRYQTVYARSVGSVAAPTAGLHFDEALLDHLQRLGIGFARVTLHVGAGTFQPVRSENLAQHRMHAERYAVPEATAHAIADTKVRGGRVVAVGTTTIRVLESAAVATGEVRPGEGETRLFITPGYSFKVADCLITNFHLPKSSLLMLVSAFGGYAELRAAYAHAIERRYRFFSYGDAMFLYRKVE